METNDELITRHKVVTLRYQEAKRKAEKMRPSGAKDNASRFAGSLLFTLLQIESEMKDRNLVVRESEKYG
jgi:hypothetical protein